MSAKEQIVTMFVLVEITCKVIVVTTGTFQVALKAFVLVSFVGIWAL